MLINENYLNLEQSYLFPMISKRVAEFKKNHPEKEVISLGIGDVTLPLPQVCIKALIEASKEMGKKETFRGYGPEQGYEFLLNAIIEGDYKPLGINLSKDEVFVSDGAKCDVGNIQEILSPQNSVLICDPVYPVYLDTNIMAGRKINKLICTAQNNFVPKVPSYKADIIYLCSPNNPTGSVLTHKELKEWVAYARENNSLIIFDSAYKEYIQDSSLPRSIYEIEGAKEVAIEIRSFSKTAGFTGLRCAYMVVPLELKGQGPKGLVNLNPLWRRRHTTKFNGVSYIVQRAAQAIYTPQGQKEIKEMISYYMQNAKIIKEELGKKFKVYGGENAPYIWLEVGKDSWQFFDELLNKCAIVGTPGSGFGQGGQGYFRLTAFGSRENTLKALERIKKL